MTRAAQASTPPAPASSDARSPGLPPRCSSLFYAAPGPGSLFTKRAQKNKIRLWFLDFLITGDWRLLMNVYCDRQSVDFSEIAFLFDGRRLWAEQTPNELEMEDGDEIDAMLHQTGGAVAY
ncbi:hypothetical protein ACS0TY_007204 [Phlomoides rotata]